MIDLFQEALSLLGVGMITVFIILMVVVFIGKGIILFVNGFFPETDSKGSSAESVKINLNASKTAAVVAAVQLVTKGRGKVVNIEKIH